MFLGIDGVSMEREKAENEYQIVRDIFYGYAGCLRQSVFCASYCIVGAL